jgi:hypothetical protein
MLITVPQLRAGDVANIRRAWSCPDFQLPEPLVYLNWKIDPGPNVRVVEVRFGQATVTGSDPWTIVWVTADVPDETYPIEFQTQNPKTFGPKPKLTDDDIKRVISQMKQAGDFSAVLDHHARVMAESELDTGVVG